mgnify:CR=1 FL=1
MRTGEGLLNLLFPERCVVCDGISDRPGKGLCKECQDKIIYIKEPFCMKCGKQLRSGEREYCGDCEKKGHYFIQGTALYDYGSMADSISRFKYGGRTEYASFYGRELYEKKRQWLMAIRPQALVPVPVHASRKRKRGYNQAELIARELSACSGIPVNTALIRRERKTRPLKALSQTERQNNLKRAFKICQNDVKLKTIVIIDDIYTTGSTVDEMARVLAGAGVTRVYFMALTIGRGI